MGSSCLPGLPSASPQGLGLVPALVCPSTDLTRTGWGRARGLGPGLGGPHSAAGPDSGCEKRL